LGNINISGSISTLGKYYVNELNFQDEEGEGLTCYDVIESILRYINYGAFMLGGECIVFDNDEFSKSINGDEITKSDVNISIGDTYNLITIRN
jgi:hypothetical protein